MDLNNIDENYINTALDEKKLTDEQIEEIKTRCFKDLETLFTQAGRFDGRQAFEDMVDSLCIDHYGFSFLHDALKIMKKSNHPGVCYQPLNGGKALLISPIGWKVMEESIVKNKPTIIVMREQTMAEHEAEMEQMG